MSTDSEKDREPLAVAFFLVLFLGSIAALTALFWSFVTDFVLALLFTALCYPLYERLLPRVKGRPWIAASLVCLLLVFVVALPTGFLVVSLSAEAAGLYGQLRSTLTVEGVEQVLSGQGPVGEWLQRATDLLGLEDPRSSIKDAMKSTAGAAAAVLGQVNAVLGNILSGLYHFVITMLVVFYLLIDGPRLKRFIFHLSPLPDHEEELIGVKFRDVGRAILFGNGVGSVLQGLLGGIAMAIAGVPSPVLWGTVMALFAFLPLVGISVVSVPATIYLVIQGRYLSAVVFFVFCTAVGLVSENVIKTKLIGSHMQMHNLLIFLAILGGIALFGIIGILYGPLIVALFLTLDELYEQHYKTSLAQRIAGVRGD